MAGLCGTTEVRTAFEGSTEAAVLKAFMTYADIKGRKEATQLLNRELAPITGEGGRRLLRVKGRQTGFAALREWPPRSDASAAY